VDYFMDYVFPTPVSQEPCLCRGGVVTLGAGLAPNTALFSVVEWGAAAAAGVKESDHWSGVHFPPSKVFPGVTTFSFPG